MMLKLEPIFEAAETIKQQLGVSEMPIILLFPQGRFCIEVTDAVTMWVSTSNQAFFSIYCSGTNPTPSSDVKL